MNRGSRGIVAKDPADRADRLAEGAVRDHDVSPDTLEDFLTRHDPPPIGEEEREQIEVARDQRRVRAVAPQGAVGGRQNKWAEAEASHGGVAAASDLTGSLR